MSLTSSNERTRKTVSAGKIQPSYVVLSHWDVAILFREIGELKGGGNDLLMFVCVRLCTSIPSLHESVARFIAERKLGIRIGTGDYV